MHKTARVAALAEGDEILATEETLAGLHASFKLSEPRDVALKGIPDPGRVVTVEWR